MKRLSLVAVLALFAPSVFAQQNVPGSGPVVFHPAGGGGGTPTYPLLAPDGSESAPSYSFASDPDTGFFAGFGTGYVNFAADGRDIGWFTRIPNGPEFFIGDASPSAPSNKFSTIGTYGEGGATLQMNAFGGTYPGTIAGINLANLQVFAFGGSHTGGTNGAASMLLSNGAVPLYVVTGSTPTIAATISGTDQSIAITSTLTSSRTSDFGWTIQAGANTACNTTCTSACVAGQDTTAATKPLVGCADASADLCICAGSS